jgi:hypothetical protein
MPLTIASSSTDDVYTTTAYVKSLIGTTATSDDATISALIRAGSRWVDNYIGYPIAAAKYRETVPTYDRRKMMLARYPIRNVSGLFFGTDTGGSAAEFLSSEFRIESRDGGFLSRDEGFEWTVPMDQELTMRPRTGHEYKPWLVDYVAGYTLNGIDTGSPLWSTEHGTTSTGRSLPEDIEHATALRVVALYEGNEDVVMEMLGDLQVHYRSGARDPEVAKLTVYEQILEPYRRFV